FCPSGFLAGAAAGSAAARTPLAASEAASAMQGRSRRIMRYPGKGQFASLAQRRLRQQPLQWREPINGSQAAIARPRGHGIAGTEQARETIGDALHREHRLGAVAHEPL